MRDYPHVSHYALVDLAVLHSKQRDIEQSEAKRRPLEGYSLEEILTDVCEVFKISTDEVTGRNRQHEIVMCRKIFCHVARTITHFSVTKIGQCIGSRDHTTVIHHSKQVRDMFKVQDADFLKYWTKYATNSKLFTKNDFK